MARETLTFAEKLRIATWLNTHDARLAEAKYDIKSAFAECNLDLGFEFNLNHFNGVRKELQLKWDGGVRLRGSRRNYGKEINVLANVLINLYEVFERVPPQELVDLVRSGEEDEVQQTKES